MAEGLVLNPAADLVQAAVGDPDYMKRISHPCGVGKIGIEPRTVGLVKIASYGANSGEPVLFAAGEPPSEVLGRVSTYQIDHPVAIKVNHAGSVNRGVARFGLEKRGLIHPQLAGAPNPLGVVHHWPAVLGYLVPNRPPRHPKLPGQGGHRSALLTYLPASFLTGPASKHRAGTNVGA